MVDHMPKLMFDAKIGPRFCNNKEIYPENQSCLTGQKRKQNVFIPTRVYFLISACTTHYLKRQNFEMTLIIHLKISRRK